MRADRVVLSRASIVAIAATYLLMGLTVAAYGPLLEHLTRRFGVSLPVAGATISVHFGASMAGVLTAMRSMERLPARVTVMIAMLVVATGAVAVAIAGAWWSFLIGVSIIGIGFGALVLALNQLVAYSEGRRRAALLNGLNGAYSAGAVAGPILVAAFAATHFSLLYLGAAVVALGLIPGGARISGRLPVRSGSPGRPELLVGIFVLAVTLYVAIENGTAGWMTSHLEYTGLRSTQAAAVTSGFWLALVTGRLLMTLVPARVSEATIVITGAAVATLALLAATVGVIAPVAYVVTGLFLAPIFPTGIVWLARLRPGDARATSWLYPAAAVGGAFGPGAIGLVIAGFGLGAAPLVLAMVAVGMVSAFALAARLR